MGAPGPTIAGGRLSVGSGYIGELGGMLGQLAVGFFDAMTAGASISRRSAKLGPELVQKKGKPRSCLR
jgi:hypothetical protein